MSKPDQYFYVARQPILDQQQRCHGYELLFRDGPNNAFPVIDAEQATSRIIASSHFTLSLDELTGDYPAFINFSELALLHHLPELLPPERVVLEILESVAPTDELVATLANLQQKGYQIALDDFVYSPEMERLLPYASIVKLDILQHGIEGLPQQIEALKGYDVKLLAEKVENHEQFKQTKALGFELFQGYFFARPEIFRNRQLQSYQATLLSVLAATTKEPVDFEELEQMIGSDVSLSYKLLRFVNSVFFYRKTSISTLRQALIYLGERQLRDFVMLLVTSGLTTQKPTLLASLAMIRSHFAASLAEQYHPELKDKAFIAGLFSLLPALLDRPMPNIINKLNLDPEITDALMFNRGVLANLLALCRNYEKGNWQDIDVLSDRLELPLVDVSGQY